MSSFHHIVYNSHLKRLVQFLLSAKTFSCYENACEIIHQLNDSAQWHHCAQCAQGFVVGFHCYGLLLLLFFVSWLLLDTQFTAVWFVPVWQGSHLHIKIYDCRQDTLISCCTATSIHIIGNFLCVFVTVLWPFFCSFCSATVTAAAVASILLLLVALPFYVRMHKFIRQWFLGDTLQNCNSSNFKRFKKRHHSIAMKLNSARV